MGNNVTIKELVNILPYVIKAKLPILIRGPHGIGKSEVVRQFAEQIGMKVVEQRASQLTEGDTLGIPDINGMEMKSAEGNRRKNASYFRAFEWLAEACIEPRVLFFDEIDRAVPEVRQSLMQLTDSRRLANHVLHEGTLIFAAINGSDNNISYDVKDFDPAEFSRWTVFDLVLSVDEWASYARSKNVLREIIEFLVEHKNFFMHTSAFEPGKIYPSPRSWMRLDSVIHSEFKALMNVSEILHQIVSAFVGPEASFKFIEFAKKMKVIGVDDIFNKKAAKSIFELSVPELTEIINRVVDSGFFKENLSDKQVKNVQYFIVNIPAELSIHLYRMIAAAGNKETFKQIHAGIKERIVEILKDPTFQKKLEEQEKK